jgi:hypothetical protein
MRWLRELDKKVSMADRHQPEVDPPLRVFKRANPNIQMLDEYPEGKELEDDYWNRWVTNPYKQETGCMIDHVKMGEVADRLKLPNKLKVKTITKMLEEGADLGIKGKGRWPSAGPNNKTVYEYGARVADSLQTAIKQGIMYGPLKRDEMPWEEFKVSPMTVSTIM